jgi:hypothetical protein
MPGSRVRVPPLLLTSQSLTLSTSSCFSGAGTPSTDSRNLEEERVRRLVKQQGSAKLRKKRLEEIDLSHISMRYDIMLNEEVATTVTARQR